MWVWKAYYSWEDEFDFGLAEFEMSSRNSNKDMEKAIRYASLEYEREIWAGDIYKFGNS